MLVRTCLPHLARVTFFGALIASVSCGAKRIPTELLDARVAFERAQAGPSKTVNPAGLFEASKALDTAERRQQKSPGSLDARDAAYVALRKIQLAEANTQSALTEAKERSTLSATDERAKRTIGETPATTGATGATGATADEREPRIAPTRARARSTEDGACEAVMRALDGRVTMRVDDRGLVLTLADDDTFVGRTSMLTPAAADELDAIAEALRRDAGNATVEVYGFSDDVGNEERNLELSTSRAHAVRDFLVSRGVRADAEGRGARDAVDSNASPEGRANNRRIEIVARIRGVR